MDDPWGSPWATTASDKDQKPASSSARSGLAPPPRAFLSASGSPQVPPILEQSPWGGSDGGFGDWAAAPDAPAAQAGWASGWGALSSSLTPPTRDDVFGKASPIAWPGNVADPRLANGFGFRQPSPDPWASGFPSGRGSIDGASTPRLMVDPASPAHTSPTVTPQVDVEMQTERVWDRSDSDNTATPEETAAGVGPLSSDSIPAVNGQKKEENGTNLDVARLSVELAAQDKDYPSSTASNDNTDQEEERQDSSNTSIDDERSIHRPESRKTSGKVQELVVKFDRLARAASQECLPSLRNRSKSPLSLGERDASDDAGEFGDFEEAGQDEPSTLVNAPEEAQPREESPPPKASAVSSPSSPRRSSLSESTNAKFCFLDFVVNLDAIGKLFETASTGVPNIHNDVSPEIPDHIIRDSFTEISERKTWYRVSRIGSSRRHNAGDDDSYRRVAWPSSIVHDETIKIVRRWMEEDSIAGRVALGGGVSKTQKNMFGWDSNAEPVALDAVFRKKVCGSRRPSHQSSHVAGRRPGSFDNPVEKTLQGSKHGSSGSTGQLPAVFAWSGPAIPESVTNTSGTPEPPVSTSAVPSMPPIPSNPFVDKVKNDDIDEEWGEIVSSPAELQPAASQIHSSSSALTVAPVPAPQQAIRPAPSTTATPAPIIAPEAANPGGSADDAWVSVDLSIFEPGPVQPSSNAGDSARARNSLEALASKPMLASVSTIQADSSISGTKSSVLDQPKLSSVDAAYRNDDEAARRILANLPDLSYMLR
ncbi:hypothetical protein N656DRAFT_749289 [Canariomyces notabilis]|uniref:Glucan 1, 4-alpha-glucosidase n=1 Tax=Canariomyces notabilis TaxID=2074819 RepID=A0AAN6YVQ0_9PEZI|nr:hypothetical protein N656DRAFT_749289 [Canariomyces arenarius]